jgi:hypothetical protein
MAAGSWVAITLDNLAEALLVRGDGDAACEYLYRTLNHASPLITWCEERGPEPGTATYSGDPQHLWTPVAVVRAIRDFLILEEGTGLHLARGAARSWLGSGMQVGIARACTHFGRVSYQLQYDAELAYATCIMDFPQESALEWARVYVRLPRKLHITSVISQEPEFETSVLEHGIGFELAQPRGRILMVVAIGS